MGLGHGQQKQNEEGKTVINSVIVDITERRHTNDTIRRQKAFFQSLYDTTLCALVQYDLNGTFLNAEPPSPSMSSATPKSSSARKPADRS